MSGGRPTWVGFLGWTLVGVALGFATVSLNLGAAVLALILLVVTVVRPRLVASGYGLLTGLGLLSLYIAFLQRLGPGTVCWQTATASGCDEYLDPLPWLIVGVVLAALGIGMHVSRMRRERVEPS